ncbi:MAG: hypothetical protein FJX60_23330 [Alphaproteobacteria bacterium]|nr:hypothetical protein [Alphaproteobacteria bacterium]
MIAASDMSDRLGKLIENLGLVSKGLLGSQRAVYASDFLATCAEVESLLAEAAALPPSPDLAESLRRLVTELDQVARDVKAKLRASQLVGAALKAGIRRSSAPSTYGPPLNGAVSALESAGRLYI